ncbi:MAG: N-acyl-D-glutamate amidohydrolase, partial [Burkholderiaceae bacterium]
MFDLLLRDGLVFDGRDAPPLQADIGIRDGQIAAIGNNLTEPARRDISAKGRWITPGFVDVHTHSDVELEIAPGLPESVRHGVTSVVIGNCS